MARQRVPQHGPDHPGELDGLAEAVGFFRSVAVRRFRIGDFVLGGQLHYERSTVASAWVRRMDKGMILEA